MEIDALKAMALEVRKTILRCVYKAGSGHPGGSLSAADIMTALYFDIMKVDPSKPNATDRDRFVLSKGHAAPALYAALGLRGFFPPEDALTLRQLGSHFQGHPNMHKVPGIDMSTGSLGQGISAAVGMALGARLDNSSRRIYTLLGDGELQEGIVWEAVMAAGHYKLGNLLAFVDNNGLQIDGANEEVMTVQPIKEKFSSFGWNVLSCDGHDMEAIVATAKEAQGCQNKPTVIVAKTIKGKGVSFMENQGGWHGKAPSDEEFKQAMKELGGDN